jgi:hypothetical protein
MLTHRDFHFSIIVHTDDLGALHCLRGLSMHAQKEGNTRIPWGGTKKKDWKTHHHDVTFHFSTPQYRLYFEREALRLLPEGTWTKLRENDNDPAEPQADKGAWD